MCNNMDEKQSKLKTCTHIDSKLSFTIYRVYNLDLVFNLSEF